VVFELIIPDTFVDKLNLAVTFFTASIVTWHVDALPEQSPDQPVNVEPELEAAVNVTTVPGLYASEQSVFATSQLIPAGLLVTVPVPVPVFITVSGPLTWTL
jgi:hypothetical protein